jgi:hypothetical protein
MSCRAAACSASTCRRATPGVNIARSAGSAGSAGCNKTERVEADLLDTGALGDVLVLGEDSGLPLQQVVPRVGLRLLRQPTGSSVRGACVPGLCACACACIWISNAAVLCLGGGGGTFSEGWKPKIILGTRATPGATWHGRFD